MNDLKTSIAGTTICVLFALFGISSLFGDTKLGAHIVVIVLIGVPLMLFFLAMRPMLGWFFRWLFNIK